MFEQTPGHQVAEVTEDQATGSDMYHVLHIVPGPGAPHAPNGQPANENDKQGNSHEVGLAPGRHQAAQDEQGQGVGYQVAETAVQEGTQRYAAQPFDSAGYKTILVQAVVH